MKALTSAVLTARRGEGDKKMKIKTWNVEAITGYKPKTTFYDDFSIADKFGEAAIKDTCNRAYKEWKDYVEYLTELVMVLNWKTWEHHDAGNERYVELYSDLYYAVDDLAREKLTGDDLAYYYNTLD